MRTCLIFLLIFSFSISAKESYFDNYGRIHDKIVLDGTASSNNGWFYSAIYKKLGGDLEINEEVAQYCVKHKVRDPHKKNIPISRDEILGLAYLGYLKKEDLDGWSFAPKKLEKFNIIKFVKESFDLVESFFPFKLKHRNHFWQNNLKQIEHTAYSVPIQDRHFLLQLWGEYNLFYHIVHIVDNIIPSSDRSSRQIKFLKTGKDISSVINYYKDKKHPSVSLAKYKKRR